MKRILKEVLFWTVVPVIFISKVIFESYKFWCYKKLVNSGKPVSQSDQNANKSDYNRN